MRKKPYPALELTGGLNVSLDPSFLTDKDSPNLNRVRFHKGILKKDYEFKVMGAVDERPMLIDTYYKTDGTEQMLLITVDKAYKWSNSQWEFITGSDVFTGGANDIFQSTIMNDYLLVTNGTDPIYKYDGTTWAVVGGMAAPDPVILAKTFIVFYNYLILGYTTEDSVACPLRMRWCNTADFEEWDDATTNAGYKDLADTIDWMVGFSLLRDKCYAFKERSIWEITHVGEPNIFDVNLIVDGIGTYDGNSIINLGEEIAFLGTDNVYTFDGSTVRSIGDKIYSFLYETEDKKVNSSMLYKAPSVYMEETGDYVLVLPTTTDEPDWMIKYNLSDENWTQRTQDCVCAGYNSVGGRTTWSAATGTWEDLAWDVSWKYKSLPPGAPTTLYGDSHGTIWEDDRTTTLKPIVWREEESLWSEETKAWNAMEETTQMIWESKDWIFGHGSRIVEVRFQAKSSGSFDVRYSLDEGVTWSAVQTLTPGDTSFNEVVAYLNETAQTFRVKISSEAETLEIKWIEPWYVSRERSKELD